jgi:uncharacterized caspase-like protein
MPKISPFSKINCYLALAHLFFFLTILPGCATSPVIKMPEAMPDIVREYKSVKIYGFNSGLVNTGVRVKKGDYYTIMASGEIHYRLPRAPISSVGPDVILYWQEGKEYPYPYSYSGGNNNLRAKRSGIIFLSILPLPAGGGSFSVDIIIWKKEDPVLIGNFFNDLVSKDPQNRILNSFANYFRTEKDILLAEQKAAKEIEETQKALLALKEEAPKQVEEKPKPAVANSQAKEIKQAKKEEPMPQLPIVSPKLQEEKKSTLPIKEKDIPRVKDSLPAPEKQTPGIEDVEKEKKIAELNERLQKAMQALNDLEDMKEKMAEQQKKVEEQRGKEQVLTARLDALEKGKSMPSQTPPLIAIANPKDGISVDSEYISFAGVAEHEKGIIKFEIMVNNEPVTFKDQRGLKIVPKEQKRIEFSERIRLKQGKNEITVIAQEKEGQTAKKTISVQMTKKQEEIWAVVIGINKYLNLPSLKYAANDGKEFYRYLVEVNKIPKDHIWLLLDEEATLDKLRSVLGTQLRRKAGKDDMVIIYLAGHGATEKDATSLDGDGLEKYILPHNADPKDLYASAMPMGEVSRIFDRISSEKLVFLSDTCYSGATGGRTIPVMGRRANVSGAFLDRLSQGKGRVIITASAANQVSVEKDELKHGVFTYYLLEGLRGKADMDGDGFVTVDEIYRYVSIKVPQATGQDQHPVKKGEMKGQIVLGVAR